MEMMKSTVVFADDKVRKSIEKLNRIKSEDRNLKKWIERAMKDLETDAFCGTQIPKKLFPKEYVRKYKIDNLWKYNLPNAWRLIYTVTPGGITVFSVILEWMPHKDYEKRFKY